MTVECAFQGSKVFEGGGPFTDLYEGVSREAKKDTRLRSSGELLKFRFKDIEYPLEPKTAFYDWLYLRALLDNPQLSDHLQEYKGFTDIAFNPKKSINCQARAAALFVALRRQSAIGENTLRTWSSYLDLINSNAIPKADGPNQSAHPGLLLN